MLPERNVLPQELGANAVECQNLSHLLQSAYQGRYDPIELQQALNKHKDSLSNPLWHKTRNNETTQFIDKNRHNYQLDGIYRPIQLSNEDINLVRKFADKTHLNQRYIVSYLYDARVFVETERIEQQQRQLHLSFQNQNHSSDIPKIRQFIKNAYFNARKLRLKVLRELIVVYDRITPKQDDNKMQEDNVNEIVYPQELRKIISNTVEYLFNKNLITNLCNSIKVNLNPNRDRTYGELYSGEVCDCMAIFYAISQRIECDFNDINSLLSCFSFIIENVLFNDSYRIRSCTYILSLSLYQLLDPSLHSPYINPRNQSSIGNNNILNKQNSEQLHLKLNTKLNELSNINKINYLQRYSGSFLLLIIVMIYKIQAKVEQKTYNSKYCGIALRHGALEGLYRDLLVSPTLLEEFSEMKHTLYVTLADTFCELFELCDKDLRDYYAREKKQQAHINKKQNRGLSTMLNVLIYLSHNSGPFCDMFIKNASGKSFIEFLDNTADIPTPWFHLYAQFIYELARRQPQLVYQHITTEKCEKLTIDAICAILQKTADIYRPKPISQAQISYENMNTLNTDNMNPYQRIIKDQERINWLNNNNMSNEIIWQEPPEMNGQEIRIVCSVLKVLEALGCIDSVQQQIDYQHRPPGIIAVLFSLCECQIPSQVMAQTISCISAFCKTIPQQADKVWKLLEKNQILYTQRQKNQPITKGVELDIIEGEKFGSDATYPVTISFCKLVHVLLSTTSINPFLGLNARGSRPPGIYPYTDYIRDVVFLRWSKRQYKNDKEQWEMAATSLQIFIELLNKFNPSNLKPESNIRQQFKKFPSFELLTLLLAPHSPLIEVVLDIYQKAFDIIDKETQYSDDTMEFVKLALVHSLNLIKKAIEKEDSFLNICQKYWPQRLSLRPLNTTLLSQQYREQIISFAKCVEYGNDIVVASHALSILTHLNKTQQGINLRSRFTDQIFILQNSFSTQLYNPPLNNTSNLFDNINEPLPDIRVSIVQFLLKSLNVSGHNLGLMLLAFSEQSASRDQLQSNVSCLNAILKICIEPEFCFHSSALAEACFELLFRLLSNTRIGERFLNAAESVCSSFFVTLLRQNIACTSILPNDTQIDQRQLLTCFLNQRAWLLRAISFEFHLAYSFNKTGIFDPQDIQYLGLVNDPNTEATEFALWKIFELLDIKIGPNIDLDNANTIWGINMEQFKQYNNQQRNSIFTWNIPKMYFSLDRAPASQNLHDKQIQLEAISAEALNHNIRVSLMSAMDFSYLAWAELIRCILSNKIIDYNTINNQLLLKLLDNILVRLSTSVYGPMWSNVANTISQVALNIMYFFRHSLGEEYPVQITIVGCTTILEGMINSILTQKDIRNPRANLYSCLSNYLHYCKFKVPNVLSDADESKAINLNEKVTTEKDKLNCSNVAMLLSRKDELLDVLFSDSVSKDAYLSSVSSLILQDLLSEHDNVTLEEFNVPPPRIWLSMLLEKSRLLFILRATCDLDNYISKALASQRRWVFLYQFESMMDILISTSMYENGTNELIDNNCISQYLTQLQCLQSRVFWTAYTNTNNSGNDNEHDSLSMECSRYLQLLTPCLRLINSMFSSCPKNVRLHYQTLTFFQKHNDIVNKLLTLDNTEFIVLRCIKLIISIWYQLYSGPLYINNNQLSANQSTISARDSTILQHIESKIQIFYFLIKKFKNIAFKKSSQYNQSNILYDNENDFDIINTSSIIYNESVYTQIKGETKETISRELVRLLLNIFRIKSIGSSKKIIVTKITNENKIFEKDLSTNNQKITNDNPPNLRLLCDCLIGIIPISKQTGKWIQLQNNELKQIANNNNANMLAKLQYIEPMLSTVSMDVNLQCFLIENILLLLYFHCEFYLKSYENDNTDFYHKFNSVVMCEVIQLLQTWYNDENSCILHVRQDMIEKRWTNGVHIPKSTKMFIEIMLEKFCILDRDNRNLLSIQQ